MFKKEETNSLLQSLASKAKNNSLILSRYFLNYLQIDFLIPKFLIFNCKMRNNLQAFVYTSQQNVQMSTNFRNVYVSK